MSLIDGDGDDSSNGLDESCWYRIKGWEGEEMERGFWEDTRRKRRWTGSELERRGEGEGWETDELADLTRKDENLGYAWEEVDAIHAFLWEEGMTMLEGVWVLKRRGRDGRGDERTSARDGMMMAGLTAELVPGSYVYQRTWPSDVPR